MTILTRVSLAGKIDGVSTHAEMSIKWGTLADIKCRVRGKALIRYREGPFLVAPSMAVRTVRPLQVEIPSVSLSKLPADVRRTAGRSGATTSTAASCGKSAP